MIFRVCSGYVQGIFVEFQAISRVFFPMPFLGMTWVHQTIAFAIASEFCRKLPFARKFCSEDEIFAISFAKSVAHSLANSFATHNSQLFVWDLVVKFASEFFRARQNWHRIRSCIAATAAPFWVWPSSEIFQISCLWSECATPSQPCWKLRPPSRLCFALVLRPCPSFPCFFGKRQGKPQKKQGFFRPAEPLKSLEKKGKTLEKTRNSSPAKKTRNSKKARKGRTGEVSDTMAPLSRGCAP